MERIIGYFVDQYYRRFRKGAHLSDIEHFLLRLRLRLGDKFDTWWALRFLENPMETEFYEVKKTPFGEIFLPKRKVSIEGFLYEREVREAVKEALEDREVEKKTIKSVLLIVLLAAILSPVVLWSELVFAIIVTVIVLFLIWSFFEKEEENDDMSDVSE